MNAAALYISIPYSRISQYTGMQHVPETGLNLIIDTGEIEAGSIIHLPQEFQYDYIFSLSGSLLKQTDIGHILPQLYILFTLSGSFRKGNPYIPVFTDTGEDPMPGLQLVKQYFSLQGDPVEFVFFNPGNGLQVANNILVCPIDAYKNMDDRLFDDYCDKKPVRIILTPPVPNAVWEAIPSLEREILNNRKAALLLEIVRLRAEAARQVHKSGLWKARADLYFSFISLSKKVGENQYYNIIDWYNKEYEILPLWYKRFGHILKVLKGKRTVKSLFEKNR